MNALRVAISLFVGVLIAIALLGWAWTTSHQTPRQAIASHAVLGLGVLAGVAGVIASWWVRPGNGRGPVH